MIVQYPRVFIDEESGKVVLNESPVLQKINDKDSERLLLSSKRLEERRTKLSETGGKKL